MMSRDTAMRALQARINAAREAALAAVGVPLPLDEPVNDIPDGGPVLPFCTYDDPSDQPPVTDKIVRHLGLYSGQGRTVTRYVGDGAEPAHSAELEWYVIVPHPLKSDAVDIRAKGLAELDAVLTPIETRFEDPDTDELLAILFEIDTVDYLVEDVGTAIMLGAVISLSFTLDAPSVLT